mmetsp:Transcript_106617/g.206548  ORF Transcript_106617/g.206548 Transcript_106617/m.206548 type:complete len:214 (-) Transcript_106617:173-814(-)
MFSSAYVQILPQPATLLCAPALQKSLSDSLDLQARQCAVCCRQQPSLSTVAVVVPLVVVALVFVDVLVIVLVIVLVAVLMTVLLVAGACAVGVTALVTCSATAEALVVGPFEDAWWPPQPTICEFQDLLQNSLTVSPASQASLSAGRPWHPPGFCLAAASNISPLRPCPITPLPPQLTTTTRAAVIQMQAARRPCRGMALHGCSKSGHVEAGV